MDFDSPDVEKEFPGLFAESRNPDKDSDFSDEDKREPLIGKKKDKKDKGYVAFEGESSEDNMEEQKNSSKTKKSKSFKFLGDKKDKSSKNRENKKEEESKKESKKKKELKVKLPKHKKKHHSQRDEKKKEYLPIFGVPLSQAIERSQIHDGFDLPIIVRECIDYIEEHGLACEGIYRSSGMKSKVRQLRDQYNQGEKVYLYEHEPRIVASLLKQFLREIPEPILTSELLPKFEEASALKNEQKKIETLRKLVTSLPRCNYLLLAWLMVHLQHVVKMEKLNKMNIQSLSAALGPSLHFSQSVISAFFTHSAVIFEDVSIKKYTSPPLATGHSHLSLDLPDTPTAIEDELTRQETLLNQLHAELTTGLRDPQKEEQLWEVQRIVTQLKRKLRFLKQVATKSELYIDTRLQEPSNHTPELEELKSEKVSIKEIPEEEKEAERELEPSPKGPFKTVISITGRIDSDASSIENEPPPEIYEKISIASKEGTPEPDAQIIQLLKEERRVLLEQEELCLIVDELRRKISTERHEINRLRIDIADYMHLYKYRQFSFDSTENSSESDDSAVEADEDEDLQQELENLIKDNQELEKKNADLIHQIQEEREACIQIKVEMRLLQFPIAG